MFNPLKNSPIKGMTMIELIIVVSIAALLVTLGIPGFRSFIDNNRASSFNSGISAALRIARSESIKRNGPVYVCGATSSTNATCNLSLTTWSYGWLVWDATNSVLIQKFDLSSNTNSTTVTVTANGTNAYVKFLPPSGILDNTTANTITIGGGNSTCSAQRIVNILASGVFTSAAAQASSSCY
ncbi:MAG: ral secretion pathway, GspH [Francisellaceae bacterium]|nr:ral secretion pathway, GspH [Francisellaceae bacterium]